jgi:hypothetical protein
MKSGIRNFFEPTYLGYGTFRGTGAKKDLDFDLAYMAESGLYIQASISNMDLTIL